MICKNHEGTALFFPQSCGKKRTCRLTRGRLLPVIVMKICHCYENKVGTFRKRAQEIDPEPGRFFRLDYAQAIADVGGLPA